ncbi:MAG TPA: hypothetical protein VGM39_26615, partial [Kofleriaceae bacterium]
MRFLAVLVAATTALAGCATDAPDDGDLYEDGPATDGKADGVTFTPLVAVSNYAATSQQLVTTAELPGLLGGTFAADTPIVAIRTLTFGGTSARVVVDANTLEVIVASTDALSHDARIATTGELDTTPYVTALHHHSDAYVGLDPAAFGHGAPERFVITVDMCQSSKAWEQGFFEKLVALGTAIGEPVPIGVAMTGKWATAHPQQLAKLIAWDTTNALHITWIDHSYNHPLNEVAGEYQFMTAPTVDMPSEVLRLEALLLSQRVVPSPFFRFPGLTYNAHRLDQVNALGLLSLDANA